MTRAASGRPARSAKPRRCTLAQKALDTLPYPTFGYTRDFRFAWANAAARSTFGLRGVAELGRSDGPRGGELADGPFKACVSGTSPHPVSFHWQGPTGSGDFVLIPFPTPEVERASLALVLIPRELLDAALGDKPAPALRQPDASRDPREWEVARRIAVGDRVLLLAELLHISPNTVRNHLKSIFRKIGVHSQTQLVKTVRALAP
jgi:DNA-binding CsgD family transcriptional regulator